jgi:site-specific recombinase XerD
LESWRDAMARDGYAVRTINAKLAAARKMLRGVADDVTSVQVKMVLRDWARVPDAKATTTSQEDKTSADYGTRLTLLELQALIDSIDTSTVKGLRDRAIIALMAGAGLRVSEVVTLTLRDVFLTENERGQRGIKVRNGKHHKSRVVVLGGWNSWVIDAVTAYTSAIDKYPVTTPDATLFEGVKRVPGGYASNGKPLSKRGAQRAVEAHPVRRGNAGIEVAAHDLRRTYAKLCKQGGMSWEALRANMGQSSVTVTENYVGHEVDWGERVPNWKVRLA